MKTLLDDRLTEEGPSSRNLQVLADAMNAIVSLLLERPIVERKQVLVALGQAVLPPSTRT